MKKTVKSKSELNARAMQNGATVTSKSGKKFNASGSKKPVVKKIAPKKAAPVQQVQDSIIADAVEKQTSELRMVLEGLKEQMAAIKLEHPEQITDWDFHVTRDGKGEMHIKAHGYSDTAKVTH